MDDYSEAEELYYRMNCVLSKLIEVKVDIVLEHPYEDFLTNHAKYDKEKEITLMFWISHKGGKSQYKTPQVFYGKCKGLNIKRSILTSVGMQDQLEMFDHCSDKE